MEDDLIVRQAPNGLHSVAVWRKKLVKLVWALAIMVSAMPAFAQYAGPAILSRGDAPAAMATSQVDFRPFVDIAGVYTTGLSGLVASSQGTTLGNASSAGLLLNFGLSGIHSWKHTKVGLDYVGSITHYDKTTYGGYDNQSFLLSVTHQFSPHALFSLGENASIVSQPLASPGLPQTVTFDPALTYNPTTDFYDNRTLFLNTQAGLIFQKSARLSFSLGGHGSLTDRQGPGLYSVTGAGANGDMQYRWTRRSTVGASYNYMHFEYHGTFNATDVHTASGTYALQLTRSLEFTGYGGFSQAETKFLRTVPLSPVLAGLIGLQNGVVINYTATYHPTYGVRLSQSFEHGVAFLSSSYMVTPGNGLFLTSTALSAATGYNYTGVRRWSFGVTSSYTRAYSVANVVGSYQDITGRVSASRALDRFLHLTFSMSAIQYRSSNFAGYNRLTYTANLGLAFSPGNLPLRVW
jgi:hypothetical protein